MYAFSLTLTEKYKYLFLLHKWDSVHFFIKRVSPEENKSPLLGLDGWLPFLHECKFVGVFSETLFHISTDWEKRPEIIEGYWKQVLVVFPLMQMRLTRILFKFGFLIQRTQVVNPYRIWTKPCLIVSTFLFCVRRKDSHKKC